MNARTKHRWRTACWAALVVASVALTLAGLAGTFTLLSYPEFEERTGPGHGMIFAGALLSAVAAVWTRLRGHGWPVVFCVAAPVLVGWADFAVDRGLLPHLAGLSAVPAAVGGLLSGLPAATPPAAQEGQRSRR